MITELTKNGYGKSPFLSSMIHSIFLMVIRSEVVVLHPIFGIPRPRLQLSDLRRAELRVARSGRIGLKLEIHL